MRSLPNIFQTLPFYNENCFPTLTADAAHNCFFVTILPLHPHSVFTFMCPSEPTWLVSETSWLICGGTQMKPFGTTTGKRIVVFDLRFVVAVPNAGQEPLVAMR